VNKYQALLIATFVVLAIWAVELAEQATYRREMMPAFIMLVIAAIFWKRAVRRT
jgi:hypothetical protein